MTEPTPPDSPPVKTLPARHRAAGWAKLGTGLGIAAAEIAEGILHPTLAEALSIADLAIPALAALIVFTVVVRSSETTCDRVFRLLRWISNRPEPAAPAQTGIEQPQAPAPTQVDGTDETRRSLVVTA